MNLLLALYFYTNNIIFIFFCTFYTLCSFCSFCTYYTFYSFCSFYSLLIIIFTENTHDSQKQICNIQINIKCTIDSVIYRWGIALRSVYIVCDV